jgi:hypothetical protein
MGCSKRRERGRGLGESRVRGEGCDCLTPVMIKLCMHVGWLGRTMTGSLSQAALGTWYCCIQKDAGLRSTYAGLRAGMCLWLHGSCKPSSSDLSWHAACALRLCSRCRADKPGSWCVALFCALGRTTGFHQPHPVSTQIGVHHMTTYVVRCLVVVERARCCC